MTQAAAPLDLVPGVRRLRPDDHFMILSETDASPMHVGALLLLSVPEAEKPGFADAIRRQFAQRLAHTPLLVRLAQSPDGYDSDVWADLGACDLDAQVEAVRDGPTDEGALRAWVARASMGRLDLSHPPFKAFALTDLPRDICALYFKMHHAVADGIGFQTVLRLLSDATPPVSGTRADAELPAPERWRQLADARFAALEPLAKAHRERRKAALAELEARKDNLATARARTPTLKLTAPTSTERSYATLSLDFARVKRIAGALDATINDLFLALAGTALRRYLIAIDDLPDTPIVVNSARSYRRAEHGDFGNRIVALHPHIATHLADPIARLRAIQASMAIERGRTHLDEAMLDQPERPFGARDRRAKFAERTAGGKQLLPGNITLSNVPGPAEALTYAGFAQLANYPVPIIGSGRFLNITSRRNAGRLDMGVMADPTKIAHVGRFPDLLRDALDEYERLAG